MYVFTKKNEDCINIERLVKLIDEEMKIDKNEKKNASTY